jgi:triacylglycerol lipase
LSFFTKLPSRFYPGNAFDDFSPVSDFRLGTARAMAWLSQLAYETDEPDKIEQILGAWGLRLIDGVVVAEVSTVLPIASTHGFVAAGRDATFVAFAGTDPVVLANWITDLDVHLMATGAAAGYAGAAAIVWDQVAARVKRQSEAERGLFLTGHSLGGTLAAVIAKEGGNSTGYGISGLYLRHAAPG